MYVTMQNANERVNTKQGRVTNFQNENFATLQLRLWARKIIRKTGNRRPDSLSCRLCQDDSLALSRLIIPDRPRKRPGHVIQVDFRRTNPTDSLERQLKSAIDRLKPACLGGVG